MTRSSSVSSTSSAARYSIKRSARTTAIVAIDADLKRMLKTSGSCARLITVPGVPSHLAVTAALDDPERFRRSRDKSAAPQAYPTAGS